MDDEVIRYLSTAVPYGADSVEVSGDGKTWMCRICMLKGHQHAGTMEGRTTVRIRVAKHFTYHKHEERDGDWHLLPGADKYINNQVGAENPYFYVSK